MAPQPTSSHSQPHQLHPPSEPLTPQQQSFLSYAVEWLQEFGSRAPPSIHHAGQGFYDSLISHGIVVDHAENGRVICSFRVPHRLCNGGGRLHGGAIVSLVDIMGSAAIFSTGVTHTGVSVEINVSYMAEAPAEEEVEIESKVLRVGRNLAVASVDIKRKATGKVVAQGRHTKFLGAGAARTSPTSKL